jgi:hypothetical protein
MLFFCKKNCDQDNNSVQKNKSSHIQNSFENSSIIETKEDVRGEHILIFENGDTLKVVSNFFSLKKIDSFSQQNKTIKGKYFYCFRGGVSQKISEILKINEKKTNTSTAHSVIIKTDTVLFNEKKELDCLNKNDSILIKSTVYTFYQNRRETSLLLIKDLVQIK